MIDRDPRHLHAEMRERLRALNELLAVDLPTLHLYESYRSPGRQAILYARGRTTGHGTPGKTATRAPAWRSLHQYGLAADYVFRASENWSWQEPERGAWQRYHELARRCGLEALSFEKPHVQMPESLARLKVGNYPPGGGAEWVEIMAEAVTAWGDKPRVILGQTHPGAPPWQGPLADEDRPPLA